MTKMNLKKNQTGLLHENEYYQIEMENADIKAVLKSTKENFEKKNY